MGLGVKTPCGGCAGAAWVVNAAGAVQVLRWCQLSLPWAPPVLRASAIRRMSHNLPVPPLQAPWLLDTLVSRVAPVASLTHSGRLVVFPM